MEYLDTIVANKEQIWQFINSPIIMLITGGFVINYIRRKWSVQDKKSEEDRAKKEILKKEQINFLNEAGTILHEFFPYLFQEIQNYSYIKNVSKALSNKKMNLFKIRFTVFIKSKAFLQNDEFANKFDIIIENLDEIVTYLNNNELSTNKTRYNLIHIIFDYINNLQHKWKLKHNKNHINLEQKMYKQVEKELLKKMTDKEDILEEDLAKAFNIWATFIWFRAREVLEEVLDEKIIDNI